MKIKRVVIPIMSVIILCSQLAGCAALNSQEFLETVNNVDEVVIEYNELDPSSSSASTSSSDSVKVGDKAYAYDFDNKSDEEDPEVGVVETEPEELSGEALTHYFQLAYDGSKAYVSGLSTEEAIEWELDVLNIRAQNENQRLPDDYRDQYRAWRPVEEAPATTAQQAQQVSDTTKNQNKTQNQSQGSTQQQQQSQTQTQSPQNQGTPQQSKPSSSSDAYDPYDGYGSYNAYIDHICQELPQLSREEIIQRFPDPATIKAGPSTQNDAEKGLLGGN